MEQNTKGEIGQHWGILKLSSSLFMGLIKITEVKQRFEVYFRVLCYLAVKLCTIG